MKPAKIIEKLQNRKPKIMGSEHFHKSAVLLPLIEVDNTTHILFEKRALHMRSQPGDTCFPGGRIDPTDPDYEYTATRETMEELGLPSANIQDVTPLDYVVNDLGRIIYPYVGRITSKEDIIPNPDEVDEVFTVPLSFFKETEPERYKVNLHVSPANDFPYHLIAGGKEYDWKIREVEELFYQYEGKVIWGLTAKILTHFLYLLDKE